MNELFISIIIESKVFTLRELNLKFRLINKNSKTLVSFTRFTLDITLNLNSCNKFYCILVHIHSIFIFISFEIHIYQFNWFITDTRLSWMLIITTFYMNKSLCSILQKKKTNMNCLNTLTNQRNKILYSLVFFLIQ